MMIKATQIEKVKSFISQLQVSEAARTRLLSDVDAMEQVPADDRWWEDVAILPPVSLLKTVQDIRKYDSSWPEWRQPGRIPCPASL